MIIHSEGRGSNNNPRQSLIPSNSRIDFSTDFQCHAANFDNLNVWRGQQIGQEKQFIRIFYFYFSFSSTLTDLPIFVSNMCSTSCSASLTLFAGNVTKSVSP